jgi:hypothetical protein
MGNKNITRGSTRTSPKVVVGLSMSYPSRGHIYREDGSEVGFDFTEGKLSSEKYKLTKPEIMAIRKKIAPKKIESEKKLEDTLNVRVKKMGGWSIKLLSTFIKGMPDRLCLMPEGRIFFAEIKTTKKKPTKMQLLIHRRIRKLGFKVYVIDTTQQITDILKTYDTTI